MTLLMQNIPASEILDHVADAVICGCPRYHPLAERMPPWLPCKAEHGAADFIPGACKISVLAFEGADRGLQFGKFLAQPGQRVTT
jgi:hypothetical protein